MSHQRNISLRPHDLWGTLKGAEATQNGTPGPVASKPRSSADSPKTAPKQWILGDKFNTVYPHLSGVKALWETKWQLPCKLSVYPFHDGKIEDFQPIFEKLIKDGVSDAYEDEYTEYFLPTARRLVEEADKLGGGEKDKKTELYKRAACVLRIARFPSVDAGEGKGGEISLKRKVWEEQKRVYLKGASLWDEPLEEVIIPHTHAENGDDKEIPLFVRLPQGIKKGGGEDCPVVLLLTGLDGHRPDNTGRSDEFHKRGWATVITEIPGTADCPANRSDPSSPDRLFESILDWIEEQDHLDSLKVIAWGLSAGGYYAIRLAHTHHDRLIGAIGQGAGTHHFLGREWLEKVDNHEYPFKLSHAYVAKYGYKDWEELMEKAQKEYSLVDNGILKGPSCRLLLVNGMLDGLMPIEDSMLCMNYGRPKEGRFYDGMMHMGYPPANECVWPWMDEVMRSG